MDKDKSLSSGDKTNDAPKKHTIVGKMVEEGLSIQQIANILGSNERAIKRLLRYDSNKKAS
jgi:predicted transcriptional regulator